MHPALVFVLAGASVQAKTLQAVEPADVLVVHTPSDPMRPVHPCDCVYVLHVERVETQPLPLVKHPLRNAEQAALVARVAAASVQTRGLQTVEPAAVLVVHGPSDPIIPAHPLACV